MTTALTRILLVEDEPDIGDMLRLFFDWRGYAFSHACDGEEAFEIATQSMPHLILMDISLPDTDGYALTLNLRSCPRTAHIPNIFLTKWASREKRLTGLALGADDYLTKPFDLQELLLRVQNTIARAAREYFTDLRTGFPAVFTARERLNQARSDPKQAIIEVILENGIPYREQYGSATAADIYYDVSKLVLSVVNHKGRATDFVGYLDEDQFIIITAQANAQSVAGQITAVFNNSVMRYYPDVVDPADMMRLFCRITSGEERLEVS